MFQKNMYATYYLIIYYYYHIYIIKIIPNDIHIDIMKIIYIIVYVIHVYARIT